MILKKSADKKKAWKITTQGGQKVNSVHENNVLIVYTCVKSPLKRACTAI